MEVLLSPTGLEELRIPADTALWPHPENMGGVDIETLIFGPLGLTGELDLLHAAYKRLKAVGVANPALLAQAALPNLAAALLKRLNEADEAKNLALVEDPKAIACGRTIWPLPDSSFWARAVASEAEITRLRQTALKTGQELDDLKKRLERAEACLSRTDARPLEDLILGPSPQAKGKRKATQSPTVFDLTANISPVKDPSSASTKRLEKELAIADRYRAERNRLISDLKDQLHNTQLKANQWREQANAGCSKEGSQAQRKVGPSQAEIKYHDQETTIKLLRK
ncbi:hypothetical protein CF319_g5544 [Tilletia indica]|nr:hypothetical protein CF319_g5544 [Tilletia indica]